MRSGSLAFLLIGIAIGFGAMYPFMKDRAPEIVRAEPVPFVPQSGDFGAPAPPPLDQQRVQQLRAQADRNPRDVESLIELGFLYFEQQNFEEAVNWYGRALEVDPNDVGVRTDMGTAMFNLGRVDDSIAEFRKSLQVDPTHPQALFNLGVVLLEAKDDKAGALENFEKLIAAHPDFPQAAVVKQQIELLKEQ
jgi:tetratricopeptide (TPR) repeat protein